jgi:hypothetical protein
VGNSIPRRALPNWKKALASLMLSWTVDQDIKYDHVKGKK